MVLLECTGIQLSFVNVLLLVILLFVGYVVLVSRTSLPNIKSAPGWPILRQLPEVWRRPKLSHLFTKWFDGCGDSGLFQYFNFLGPERVVIYKGEFVKQVLVSRSTKYCRVDEVKDAMPSLGKGLFTAHGYHHAWQRKLMNPLFSLSSIKQYAECFDKHSINLVMLWKDKCQQHSADAVEVNVQNDLLSFALDVIGGTVLGYEFNSLQNGNNEVCTAFTNIMTTRFAMSYRLRRFLIPFYDYLPLKSNSDFRKAQKLTDSVIDAVIRSKREKLNASCSTDDDEVLDLISVMMRAREEDTGMQMTDDLLKQNAFTFLLAGHETTSVCLTWTLYHLARNPEVQEKARKEVQHVIGNCKEITSEMAMNFVYINLVIKESLRMSPPAGFLVRNNLLEETIGDHVIPLKTLILIPVVGIQNYYKFWSQPDKFLPERFENTDDTMSCGVSGQTYLPFGSGPRNCIGSKFAMLEMKICIARLLKNFRFSIRPDHPNIKGRFVFTLKPIPSPKLLITPINCIE